MSKEFFKVVFDRFFYHSLPFPRVGLLGVGLIFGCTYFFLRGVEK